ncbi:hypothetical protein N8I77_008886 [Diaporthe amygdali]|uniref:Uncharacterized protein n=1 Tax=Phomopsis amygdali TaxID=1214568 RepID=A0AAD9S911_PHOAM|nr:hypothetical protein N8I77_008886 [Diaporthe amygdali]
MMTAITLLLAPLTFVHAMSTPNVITGLGAANKVSNATGATCGVGYTYCGYILQGEKHFDMGAILTAYCAGGDCDSATGTTKTDPLQALYVCLPQAAVPKKRNTDDDKPYSGPVKLELLCACSGKPFKGEKNVCLNPDADHIGRCSTPCVNSNCVGQH